MVGSRELKTFAGHEWHWLHVPLPQHSHECRLPHISMLACVGTIPEIAEVIFDELGRQSVSEHSFATWQPHMQQQPTHGQSLQGHLQWQCRSWQHVVARSALLAMYPMIGFMCEMSAHAPSSLPP